MYKMLACRRFIVLLLCFVATCQRVTARDLRVGAFNIQVFGQTKAGKPEVMDALVKVNTNIKITMLKTCACFQGKTVAVTSKNKLSKNSTCSKMIALKGIHVATLLENVVLRVKILLVLFYKLGAGHYIYTMDEFLSE